MSGTIYTSNYLTGITLSNPATQNPATIASGVTIANSSDATNNGDAIYGTAAAAWSLTNLGTIDSTVIDTGAVYLAGGGTVTNGSNTATSALIEGGDGVFTNGQAATVVNFGTIEATSPENGHPGVFLRAGGTVIDSGMITAASGLAIYLGGTGTNLVSLAPGYAITGSVGGSASATNSIELTSATGTGTITGLGTKFTGFGGIALDAGADWLLSGANTVAGEVTLAGGSSLDNASGGTITNAGTAVYGSGGPVNVTNGGTIDGTGESAIGVELAAGGTITNTGTIEGPAVFGVYLRGGGTVTNGSSTATSALIEGGDGVFTYPQAATVVNFGTIEATSPDSGRPGAFLRGGGTVIDSGTIAAAGGDAIYLGGTGTNLVSLAPGYAITGSVGGSASATNSIELTSATGTGTITGLGTKFTAFGGIALDAGADWLLSGANTVAGEVTLAGGSSLDNASGGTITNAGTAVYGSGGPVNVTNGGTIDGTGASGRGVKLAAGGTINNTGSILGGRYPVELLAGGTVTNSGVISGGFDGVVLFNKPGTIGNSGTILGPGNIGVYLGDGGAVANTGTAALIEGSANGIFGNSTAAVVTNAGTIEGTAAGGSGIELVAGGTVIDSGTITSTGATAVKFGGTGTNLLSLAPGYAITGSVGGSASATNSIELTSAKTIGTITGIGTKFTGFGGIAVDAAADWLLSGANTVAGEVTLASGSSLDNASGGTITNAGIAVYGSGGPANVTNAGTIDGTGEFAIGVKLAAGGTITNTGTIEGPAVIGVYLRGGGTVTNGSSTATSALIEGGDGVFTNDQAATVVNFGTIESTGAGGNFGVYLRTGGTVINSGTIAGTDGVAIAFGAGNGELINESGGIIHGAIKGGAGNDVFEFTAAGLTASDTIVGGGGTDSLVFTTAGTIAASVFDHISGIGTIKLANGTDDVSLTNVGSAPDKTETVVGGTGDDTISSADVGAGTTVIFEFTTAQLTTNDKLTGGAGNNIVRFTTAGTTGVAAFTHVSNIGTIELANGTDNVTLTNVAAAPDKTETVVGGTGDDTISAANEGAGTTVIFEFTTAQLTTNDKLTGGAGDNIVRFTTAGTTGVAAFTHVSNIGTIELANGTDNVTLTNVAAAPDKTETVVGGTGDDTISAANEGAGTTVIFEFTTAQLTTNDKLTGGAGDNIVRFTTAGTIAVSVFDHISGVGTIDLANGTNNLSLANVASAPDKSETVQGGTGNDTINAAGVGAGNTVTFNGGGGNDTITGSQGDNIYQFDNTPRTLGITNSFSSGTAAHGELDFGPGLSDQSIWFLQSGNNLVAEVIGTTEKVTINGWFGSNASAKVAEIKADGLELDSKVSNLVSAMATYQSENPSFNPTAPGTTMPTDSTQDGTTLQNAIAASWHS